MKKISASSLLLAFVFSAMPACKNREFNNTSEQKTIENGAYTSVTPDRITYGFHWTSSPTVKDLNSALQWAKFQIEDAKNNSKIPENGPGPENAMAGRGLYIATDPLQSGSFGSNLLLVPIKSKSKFSYIIDEKSSTKYTVMRSNTPIVVYKYLASFVPGALERSAVIRSSASVDWENASYHSFKRGKLEIPEASEIIFLQDALNAKDLKKFLGFFQNSRKTLESLCLMADTSNIPDIYYLKTELNSIFKNAMFSEGAQCAEVKNLKKRFYVELSAF